MVPLTLYSICSVEKLVLKNQDFFLLGNEEIVEEILNKATCLTVKDVYELLRIASYEGNVAIVRVLLLKHKNLLDDLQSSQDISDPPPLILALSQRANHIARLLIEHGAQVNRNGDYWPFMTVLRSHKCFKSLVLLLENGMDMRMLDEVREIFSIFNSCPAFLSQGLRLLLIYGCDFSNASDETKKWVERDFLENYNGINPDPGACNALKGLKPAGLVVFEDIEFIPSFRDIAHIWYLVGQGHRIALSSFLSKFKAPVPLALRIVNSIISHITKSKDFTLSKELEKRYQTYEHIRDMLYYHAETQMERPVLLHRYTPPRSCSFAKTLAAILMS